MRLLGNTILIEPAPDADLQKSASGLVLVNHHKKANLKFRVLAVGPGAFRKRLRKDASGRFKTTKCFDVPQVSVGDFILTRAVLDPEVTVYSFDDGTGRIIIKADGAMAVWRE